MNGETLANGRTVVTRSRVARVTGSDKRKGSMKAKGTAVSINGGNIDQSKSRRKSAKSKVNTAAQNDDFPVQNGMNVSLVKY